ncbi:SHPS1 phosphatase, partial [Alectura lathami]|nr:SHPS1 phosphatase [Alectura lathami]
AQSGTDFEVRQPQGRVSVTVGQNLTLTCTVSGLLPLGPVRWLKGSGSDSQTVYDQRNPSPRVLRVVNESNMDFTILITDIDLEDAGTYYCVKFQKSEFGDKVFRRGGGTMVSVHETSPFPSVGVAAAVLCFVLVVLILAFCLYRRKQRAEGQSQRVAGVTTGSCWPFPVPWCAGSPRTSSEVQDAETAKLPHQPSSEVDRDIHYADLQPLPMARSPGRSPGAELTEYASIRGAAK